jgi:hypothetical protein
LRTALTAAEQEGIAIYLTAGYIALARTLAVRGDRGAAQRWQLEAPDLARDLGYAREVVISQPSVARPSPDMVGWYSILQTGCCN